MRRRELLLLLAGSMTESPAARAQQTAKEGPEKGQSVAVELIPTTAASPNPQWCSTSPKRERRTIGADEGGRVENLKNAELGRQRGAEVRRGEGGGTEVKTGGSVPISRMGPVRWSAREHNTRSGSYLGSVGEVLRKPLRRTVM